MVLEVALFPVEQKISEAKKWQNKFDHKLDTKWSYSYKKSSLSILMANPTGQTALTVLAMYLTSSDSLEFF